MHLGCGDTSFGRTLTWAMLFFASAAQAAPTYLWPHRASETLEQRIAAPPGFSRVGVETDSFAAWLRTLPVLPRSSPIQRFDGSLIPAKPAAVIDLDVGNRDLQQCADSIIRLRAEFLYASKQSDEIMFHFTNGTKATFSAWSQGWRPRVASNHRVTWEKRATADSNYASLRRYLDTVFLYAGTASLATYGNQIPLSSITAGDFFVLGGFPGHAVMVLDLATAADGRRVMLLGQGFMPAQSFHVLLNHDGSPWFPIRTEQPGFRIASWPKPFPWTSLHRFSDPSPSRGAE